MVAELPLSSGGRMSPNFYIGLAVFKLFLAYYLIHSWLFMIPALLCLLLARETVRDRKTPPRLQLFPDSLQVVRSGKCLRVPLSQIDFVNMPMFAGLRVRGYRMKFKEGRAIWLPTSQDSDRFLVELDRLRTGSKTNSLPA